MRQIEIKGRLLGQHNIFVFIISENTRQDLCTAANSCIVGSEGYCCVDPLCRLSSDFRVLYGNFLHFFLWAQSRCFFPTKCVLFALFPFYRFFHLFYLLSFSLPSVYANVFRIVSLKLKRNFCFRLRRLKLFTLFHRRALCNQITLHYNFGTVSDVIFKDFTRCQVLAKFEPRSTYHFLKTNALCFLKWKLFRGSEADACFLRSRVVCIV
jgi:hypothetical protein